MENSKRYINTILNFTKQHFLIHKIKDRKFQNSFSHYYSNMTYVHIFFLYRPMNISKKKIGKISNIKNILDQSKPNEDWKVHFIEFPFPPAKPIIIAPIYLMYLLYKVLEVQTLCNINRIWILHKIKQKNPLEIWSAASITSANPI